MMDGKHSTELVRDIRESGYDLVVLGVLGIGRTRDSQVGSVCARVAQESSRDVWVVKHLPEAGEAERDTVLVGVDGSPKSFGALPTAIELCQRFGKKLEVIAVYDPYLHYAVFKGVVEVLTEKAAKVFRFEEQNQLHEEIIDTGLAAIYQSHLNVAEQMAREAGVECTKTLLDGKCFQKVLDHARKTQALGAGGGPPRRAQPGRRHGARQQHREPAAPGALRRAADDRRGDARARRARRGEHPLDARGAGAHGARAAAGARHRAHRHPAPGARAGAQRGLLRPRHRGDGALHAQARGRAQRAARRGAGAAARRARRGGDGLHAAAASPRARRRRCSARSAAARSSRPSTPQVIARIIAEEGGAEEETTYDGRKVRWTQDAREALRAIDDRYQRRRAKARIEKAAHGGRTDLVTLELAKRFIEEETGILFAALRRSSRRREWRSAANGNGTRTATATAMATATRERACQRATAATAAAHADGRAGPSGERRRAGCRERGASLRLVARDGKGVPLLSTREWTTPAIERILRVPAGFMRDRTQERVEALAAAAGVATIDLPLVEEGIQLGMRAMEEMIAQQAAATGGSAARRAEAVPQRRRPRPALRPRRGAGQPEALRGLFPLDEVSVVSELERQRRELGTNS